MTTVRRIEPADVDIFRELRLRALRSDPDAFASTYEHEASRPLDTWQTWVALSAQGPDQSMFLAEVDGVPAGLAGAFRDEHAPRTMHLIAMWVDPAHRGKGIGRDLTDAVLTWARGADADDVTLWVVDGNAGARSLYEQAGFVATGESQPLPSNPSLVEHRMVFDLETALRMPDGYVDLMPMSGAELRAFIEWVIADRTARLIEREGLPHTEAADSVRARIIEILDGAPGTSQSFFTLRAGTDPDPRGWLWMSERRQDGSRFAVIEDLVVFEAFRGRGLAPSAVDAAVEAADLLDIPTVEARIPVEHTVARRLAASCGFVEVMTSSTEVVVRRTLR